MAKGVVEMTFENTKRTGFISINGLSRTYIDSNGNKTEALRDINIEVKPGELISLIGPSGCGKTTLLRLIAGLDKAQSGDIYLDNSTISGTHFERGYVFQHANLFPWENIENNIAAGLKARKIYKEKKDEVAHFIELSGLRGFEKSYPHQLSGGMAQRASLARALINDPKVLLLDEPLGALDSFTRFDLQDKILELWNERGTTIVLVTHDVDEAVYLSDRIVIMTPRPGKIESIIEVKLKRPRVRNSNEFIALRSDILERLHLVSRKEQLDYYL
jgi:ABC-type nitrate/sulfonate/bicarbonate transport system ATPase subunit